MTICPTDTDCSSSKLKLAHEEVKELVSPLDPSFLHIHCERGSLVFNSSYGSLPLSLDEGLTTLSASGNGISVIGPWLSEHLG